MTLTARRNFRYGPLQATFSKADARDLDSGELTPEAPRIISPFLILAGALDYRLPLLQSDEYFFRSLSGSVGSRSSRPRAQFPPQTRRL
jgi:hypothetical protein